VINLTDYCLHWKFLVIAKLNMWFLLLRPMSLLISKQLSEHQHGPFPYFCRENETAKTLLYHVLDFIGHFRVYCRHSRGYLRFTVTNTLSLVSVV
jgi:hypothetical protein